MKKNIEAVFFEQEILVAQNQRRNTDNRTNTAIQLS